MSVVGDGEAAQLNCGRRTTERRSGTFGISSPVYFTTESQSHREKWGRWGFAHKSVLRLVFCVLCDPVALWLNNGQENCILCDLRFPIWNNQPKNVLSGRKVRIAHSFAR